MINFLELISVSERDKLSLVWIELQPIRLHPLMEIIQNGLEAIHCINCSRRSTMYVDLNIVGILMGIQAGRSNNLRYFGGKFRMYKSGPRTDPCGTPKRIACQPDLLPPIATD